MPPPQRPAPAPLSCLAAPRALLGSWPCPLRVYSSSPSMPAAQLGHRVSMQSKVPPMCASRPFHCRLSRPALDFRTSSSQLRSHRDDNFGQTSILLSDLLFLP